MQANVLSVTGEATFGALRLALPLSAGAVFLGMWQPVAFQQSLTARPMLSFDEHPRTSSSLEIEGTLKRAPIDAFAAYAGQRAEVAFTQVFRPEAHGPHAFDGRLFARRERLGTEALVDPSDANCAPACFFVPLGHRAAGFAFDGRWRPLSRLGFSFALGAEWRSYDGEAPLGRLQSGRFVTIESPGRTRADRRLTGSLAADLAVFDHVALVLRADALSNRSNIEARAATTSTTTTRTSPSRCSASASSGTGSARDHGAAAGSPENKVAWASNSSTSTSTAARTRAESRKVS